MLLRRRSTRSVSLGHVLQRVGVARAHRIADARLHVAPPAVVGAAEPHEVGAARVVARQPHRLHHRLGARHVERHLVEAGDFLEPLDVVGDDRVIGAEHRAEVAHAPLPLLHALLVEVVAEHVDAVRSGQVVEAVAVEIGDRHARGRLQERPAFQVLAHHAAVLERHAIGADELQVGDAVSNLRRQPCALGEAVAVELRQPVEPGPAARNDLFRRIVGAEELLARRTRRTGSATRCAAPCAHDLSAICAWRATTRAGS